MKASTTAVPASATPAQPSRTTPIASAYAARPAAQAAKDSVAGAAAVARALGDPGLAHSADLAYLHGMSVVLLVCAGIAIVGSALVLAFLPSRPVAEPAHSGEQSVHELAGTA